jgi:outer membrane protein TolC
MKAHLKFLTAILSFFCSLTTAFAQDRTESTPRHITLTEAVELALKHNHMVRLGGFKVQEMQDAKDSAKSAYFPTISNESRIFTLTNTQFIEIPTGTLGTVAGTPIPAQPEVINQGARTVASSGTILTQPLTQLFTRIKPANEAAQAELDATRANWQATQNDVALRVHQIYYQILIAQLHRSATEAKIQADQDLEGERVEQVKFGSALDEQLIESRAELLEAKQELLTTDLQLSDLTMKLDDTMGLPITTQLTLESEVPAVEDTCQRQDCVKVALASHPEIVAARAEVEKATAGVRLAKADYVPDFSAFARYSYQTGVPFLARNFGTFGGQLTYDLFDAGRRRAAVNESDAVLAQAKENLARVTDEVELRVETAFNRLDRTREMVKVSQQILALREESSRVTTQELKEGEALPSQADAAVAQEYDAKTRLLESQLDHLQASDELVEAMGKTPK